MTENPPETAGRGCPGRGHGLRHTPLAVSARLILAWAGTLALAAPSHASTDIYLEYSFLQGSPSDSFANAGELDLGDWSFGCVLQHNPGLGLDLGMTGVSIERTTPVIKRIDDPYHPSQANVDLASTFDGMYFHVGPRIEQNFGRIHAHGYARYLIGTMGLSQETRNSDGSLNGIEDQHMDDQSSDAIEYGGGLTLYPVPYLRVGAVASWRDYSDMFIAGSRTYPGFSTWKIGAYGAMSMEKFGTPAADWSPPPVTTQAVDDLSLRLDLGMLGLFDPGIGVRASWRGFGLLFASTGLDGWIGLSRGGYPDDPEGSEKTKFVGWGWQGDVGAILARATSAEGDWLYGVSIGRRHLPLAGHEGYGTYAGDLVGLSAIAMRDRISKGYLTAGYFEDPAIDAHGADAELHFEMVSLGIGVYWKEMMKAFTFRSTFGLELLED